MDDGRILHLFYTGKFTPSFSPPTTSWDVQSPFSGPSGRVSLLKSADKDTAEAQLSWLTTAGPANTQPNIPTPLQICKYVDLEGCLLLPFRPCSAFGERRVGKEGEKTAPGVLIRTCFGSKHQLLITFYSTGLLLHQQIAYRVLNLQRPGHTHTHTRTHSRSHTHSVARCGVFGVEFKWTPWLLYTMFRAESEGDAFTAGGAHSAGLIINTLYTRQTWKVTENIYPSALSTTSSDLGCIESNVTFLTSLRLSLPAWAA